MIRSQIHHLVQESAARSPSAPAVTFQQVTWNYRQLVDTVDAVAAGFQRQGLRRGDRIAIYLDKRLETVAALLGASAAGYVFVPVNPLLRPHQVAYLLDDCDVTLLVTSPERLALLRDELTGCKALEDVVLVGDSPEVWDARAHFAVHPWATLTEGSATGPAAAPVTDADMAAILYTSGSTGQPKGVVLSHRNLLVGAESVSEYLGNTAEDVILSALPLSFDAGLSQLTTAFNVGAHVVLMNYLLPGDVVRLCAEHRVTGLTCVPPLWIQMAEQPWPAAAAVSLRYFANTGGRMPGATLTRLRGLFPQAAPFLMYGLTEAFRSTYLDPDEVDRRPDSIGKAIPNAEILVVRPDGTPCGPGEEGELVHRGPLVAQGYWNDPERTAARFRPAPGRPDGLCTPELAVWSGDSVLRDVDGFLYFVGRHDDMIKTSGYRVSPTEIEEVAYASGLVRDAVAIGVPDDRLGQRVLLVVTAANGTLDPSDVLKAMKRTLPRYMVPHEVRVRPEVPRSPNGKYDRAVLREELLP